MDQVLKKAGRIPEQILGKVSIAVSVCRSQRLEVGMFVSQCGDARSKKLPPQN